MNKNLELAANKSTTEITEAEQRLYSLLGLYDRLRNEYVSIDPKVKIWDPEVLSKLDDDLQSALHADYAKDIHNSLQAVANMLALLKQYQATRMALCAELNKAVAELAKLIAAAEEQVEKEHLMRKINAEMTNWSVDQLRAFDALVQTLHLG